MNTTKPIKIPQCEIPKHWETGDGRMGAYKAGFYAGYEQGAADHQPKTKINPYAKTSLDKYDAQIVLFCKGHFDTILKELAPEMSEIDAIKLFISEQNSIEPKYIKNQNVLGYLLNDIVEPFVASNRSNFVQDLIETSSPTYCWKVGYFKGLTLHGKPSKEPYDYIEAMIYTLISMIRLTEVKYLPGLTGQANKEWFRAELEKEMKK